MKPISLWKELKNIEADCYESVRMDRKLNIRIEWGSVFAYSPLASHNLPFKWDGSIEVIDGRVLSLQQIEFWGCFGPSRERYVPVEGNRWKSRGEPGADWE